MSLYCLTQLVGGGWLHVWNSTVALQQLLQALHAVATPAAVLAVWRSNLPIMFVWEKI
jgi:hypothetical protein